LILDTMKRMSQKTYSPHETIPDKPQTGTILMISCNQDPSQTT